MHNIAPLATKINSFLARESQLVSIYVPVASKVERFIASILTFIAKEQQLTTKVAAFVMKLNQ